MKYNLSKILNIFIAAVAAIGAILFIRIFMEDAELIKTDPDTQQSIISPIITFSTILLYLAIGVTLVLSMIALVKNPDNLKKTLIGVGALVVVLILAYLTGDSTEVTDPQGKVLAGGEEGSSINQWVSTGIWYSMFLGLIAGAFFVLDLVKGLIKS
jgi:heme/copper-type cytochrome/quinol oxidase subunit 3